MANDLVIKKGKKIRIPHQGDKRYPRSNRLANKGIRPSKLIDKDRDGIIDSEDCDPNDPNKQEGWFSDAVSGVAGAIGATVGAISSAVSGGSISEGISTGGSATQAAASSAISSVSSAISSGGSSGGGSSGGGSSYIAPSGGSTYIAPDSGVIDTSSSDQATKAAEAANTALLIQQGRDAAISKTLADQVAAAAASQAEQDRISQSLFDKPKYTIIDNRQSIMEPTIEPKKTGEKDWSDSTEILTAPVVPTVLNRKNVNIYNAALDKYKASLLARQAAQDKANGITRDAEGNAIGIETSEFSGGSGMQSMSFDNYERLRSKANELIDNLNDKLPTGATIDLKSNTLTIGGESYTAGGVNSIGQLRTTVTNSGQVIKNPEVYYNTVIQPILNNLKKLGVDVKAQTPDKIRTMIIDDGKIKTLLPEYKTIEIIPEVRNTIQRTAGEVTGLYLGAAGAMSGSSIIKPTTEISTNPFVQGAISGVGVREYVGSMPTPGAEWFSNLKNARDPTMLKPGVPSVTQRVKATEENIMKARNLGYEPIITTKEPGFFREAASGLYPKTLGQVELYADLAAVGQAATIIAPLTTAATFTVLGAKSLIDYTKAPDYSEEKAVAAAGSLGLLAATKFLKYSPFGKKPYKVTPTTQAAVEVRPFTRQRATILLKDSKGRYILGKTKSGEIISIGGGVEKGQTSKAAMFAELSQETGLGKRDLIGLKKLGTAVTPEETFITYTASVSEQALSRATAMSDVKSFVRISPKNLFIKGSTGQTSLQPISRYVPFKGKVRAYEAGLINWAEGGVKPTWLAVDTPRGQYFLGTQSRYNVPYSSQKQYLGAQEQLLAHGTSQPPILKATSLPGERAFTIIGDKTQRGQAQGLYLQPPTQPGGPGYIGLSYLGYGTSQEMAGIKVAFPIKTALLFKEKGMGAIGASPKTISGAESELLGLVGSRVSTAGRANIASIGGQRVFLQPSKFVAEGFGNIASKAGSVSSEGLAYRYITPVEVVAPLFYGRQESGSSTSRSTSSSSIVPTSYIRPSYISPSYVKPSLVPISYVKPSYVKPSYVKPSYVKPSYVKPSYVKPSYVKPSYVKPSYVKPSIIRPKVSTVLRSSNYKRPRPRQVTPKGYDVYVKRYGKVKGLGVSLTEKQAGLLAQKRLKGGLGATAFLKESGRRATKGKVQFVAKPGEFRQYRIVDGKKIYDPKLFIQRRAFRLGTRAEVSEIQKAKGKKPSFKFFMPTNQIPLTMPKPAFGSMPKKTNIRRYKKTKTPKKKKSKAKKRSSLIW